MDFVLLVSWDLMGLGTHKLPWHAIGQKKSLMD